MIVNFRLSRVFLIGLISIILLGCHTNQEIVSFIVEDSSIDYDKANNLKIYNNGCTGLEGDEIVKCQEYALRIPSSLQNIEPTGRSDYHIVYDLFNRHELDPQIVQNASWGFERLDGRINAYSQDSLRFENNKFGFEVVTYITENGFHNRILGKRSEAHSWETLYSIWCERDNSNSQKFIFQSDLDISYFENC